MAAYRFRFEAVLNYRRNLEDIARQQLAREERTLAERERELSQARQRRREISEEFEQRKKRPMAPARFTWFMESLRHQEQLIVKAAEAVERQKEAVRSARARLLDRVRDRKVMEKARQRDYQKYQRSEIARELKENDEMAVLRYKQSEPV